MSSGSHSWGDHLFCFGESPLMKLTIKDLFTKYEHWEMSYPQNVEETCNGYLVSRFFLKFGMSIRNLYFKILVRNVLIFFIFSGGLSNYFSTQTFSVPVSQQTQWTAQFQLFKNFQISIPIDNASQHRNQKFTTKKCK